MITRISRFLSTFTSAITQISLTRMGCTAIYEDLKDVYISRTFVYASLILHNCSDKCENRSLDDEANLSDFTIALLHEFLQTAKLLFYFFVLYLSNNYKIYVSNYLFLITLLHVSMFTYHPQRVYFIYTKVTR
jgi:hypothetical protein